MECSKCGKQEPRNAWHSETEEHTGRTTYTSNHSGSNPTKHTYTKLTNCRHCNYLMDRDFGFTGCTAAEFCLACGTVRILRPLSELSLSADGTEVSLRLTQNETLMLPDNQIAKVQLRVMLGGAVFATDSIPVPTKELLHREELIADAH